MTDLPYPEKRWDLPTFDYQMFYGMTYAQVQQTLDGWAPAGYVVESFGVGHNGYFWMLLKREVQ